MLKRTGRCLPVAICLAFCFANAEARAGDFNGDGAVGLDDLDTFVTVLLDGITDPAYVMVADVNQDGAANGLDIQGFITMMMMSNPQQGVGGACCFNSPPGTQFCLVLSQQDCEAGGGSYQGDGTTCRDVDIACTAPPPPDPDLVACCLPDNTCADLSPEDCEAAGGVAQPPSLTCNITNCDPNAPVGACCLGSGPVPTLCFDIRQDQCDNLAGGEYQGDGTTCGEGDLPCPPNGVTVACCLPDNSCLDLDPIECDKAGGAVQAPFSTCNTVNCDPNAPLGACCFNAGVACIELQQNECVTLGGIYQGDGTTCNDPDIDCPPDDLQLACCLPDNTCVVTSPTACQEAGGTVLAPGITCDEVNCDTGGIGGACCFVAGLYCVELSQEQCVSQGGTYQGDGTSCNDSDIDCPPNEFTVACCLPDNTCADLTPDDCLDAGGEVQGPLSSCNSVSCDPNGPVGACCFAAGVACIELQQNECNNLGGIFQGDGTSCSDPDIDCPPDDLELACCLPDNTCVVIATSACTDAGGTVLAPGTTCENVDCGATAPTGACCLPGGNGLPPGCFETSEDQCLALSGDYHGDGTSCADPAVTCPS